MQKLMHRNSRTNKVTALLLAFVLLLGSLLVPGFNPVSTVTTNASDLESRESVEISEVVDSETAFESEADYLRKNLDSKYIKNIESLDKVVNTMLIKNTLFDGNKISSEDTLDSLMANEVFLENNFQNFLRMPIGYARVLDVDSSSDYYVALVNKEINGTENRIQDVVFAKNNNNGEIVDVKYDKETGLAYIPKSLYTEETLKESEHLQVQLLTALANGKEGKKQTSLSVNGSSKIITSGSKFGGKLTFQLTNEKEMDKIDLSTLVVKVGGSELPINVLFYNVKTGRLTIELDPFVLDKVEVSYSHKGLFSDFTNLFNPKVNAATIVSADGMPAINAGNPLIVTKDAYDRIVNGDILNSFYLDNNVQLSYSGNINGASLNTSQGRVYGINNPGGYAGGGYGPDMGPKNPNSPGGNSHPNYVDYYNRLYEYVASRSEAGHNGIVKPVVEYDTEARGNYTMRMKVESLLGLQDPNRNTHLFTQSQSSNDGFNFIIATICAHIGRAAADLGSVNTASSSPDFFDIRVGARVVETGRSANGNAYIILGFVSSSVNNQSSVGVLKIEVKSEEPQIGFIKLRKVDESGRGLQGAVFEIHNERGETVQTLTTDSNGYATSAALPVKTLFWVGEKQAPNGYVISDMGKTGWLFSVGTEHPLQNPLLINNGNGIPNEREKGSVAVAKKYVDSNGTQVVVPGIVFEIFTDAQGNNKIGEMTTNEQGRAVSQPIIAGTTVYVREKAQQTQNVIVDTVMSSAVTIEHGKTINARFRGLEEHKNTTPDGEVRVYKEELTGHDEFDGRNVFANAKFKLKINSVDPIFASLDEYKSGWLRSKNGQDIIDDNNDGVIFFEKLPIGSYSIIEVESGIDGVPANTGTIDFVVEKATADNGSVVAKTRFTGNTSDDKAYEKFQAVRQQAGFTNTLTNRPQDADTFYNYLPEGSITIQKRDASNNKLLEGVSFTLVGITDTTVNQTLKTNNEGIVKFGPLKPGKYRVTESSTPAGYAVDAFSREVTVVAGQETGLNHWITVTNNPLLSGLRIHKHDVENKTDRAIFDGIVFEARSTSLLRDGVTVVDSSEVREVAIAGGTGYVDFLNMPAGIYEVREKSIPQALRDRFEINTEGRIVIDATNPQNIRVVENSNTSIKLALDSLNRTLVGLGGTATTSTLDAASRVFANRHRYGVLKIEKEKTNTNLNLAGAVFRVSGGPGNTFSKEYTTNAQGMITTEPLRVGQYTITEVQPPKGFAFANGQAFTRTVTVEAHHDHNTLDIRSNNYSLVKNDRVTGSFTITKENLLGSYAGSADLSGAKYELRVVELDYVGLTDEAQPGNVFGTYTTNAQGSFTVNNVPSGKYQLVEIQAPKGYTLNPNPIDVTISRTSLNSAVGTVAVDQRQNNNALVQEVSTLRTQLTELLKATYGQNQTYTDAQLGLDVVNTPTNEAGKADYMELVKLGRVEISKLLDSPNELAVTPTEKAPEANIQFEIYTKQNDGSKGQLVETITTNEQGKALSKWLPFGNYILSQKTTPSPSINKVADKEFSIQEHREVVSFNLENKFQQMRLKIVKLDADTGKVVLQDGVTFEVFAAKDIINPANNTVIYKKDQRVVFMNGLEEVSQLVTNAEGFTVSFNKLLAGDYYLKEVRGPKGYFVDENAKIEVRIPTIDEINAGEVKTVEITIRGKQESAVQSDVVNQPQYGELIINKVAEQLVGFDVETKVVKAQEAETVVTKTTTIPQANVQLVLEKIVDGVSTKESVKTDAQGRFAKEVTEEGTYKVFNGEQMIFTTTVAAGQKDTIEVQLAPETKTEQSYKPGAVVNKNYEINKADFEVSPLSGAKFQLVATKEIKSKDGQTVFYREGDVVKFAKEDISIGGKLVYKKGDVVSAPVVDASLVQDFILTTSAKDTVVSRVPLGEYKLKEISAPTGFKLDSTENAVVFESAEQTVRVVKKDPVTVLNERQILSIQVTKNLLERRFAEGQSVENIVFGLYTKEVVKGLPKDTLIDVANPNAEGLVQFKDVPAGTFYVKELSTLNGYVLDESEYELTTAYVANSTEDVVKSKEKPVDNKPSTYEAEVTKVDSISGKAIEGVEFKLFKVTRDGGKIAVMNGDKDYFTTDASGKIVVKDLDEGTYVWEETKVAKGYIEENKVVSIAVNEDSNLKVTIGNEPTQMSFDKVDADTGKPVVGAKLELQNEDGTIVRLSEDGYVLHGATSGREARWVTNGTAFFVKGLEVGATYKVVEIEAPAGYALADEIVFTVDAVKGVQLQKVENKLTDIRIVKTDWSTGAHVSGATLEVREVLADGTFGEIAVDRLTGKPAKWTSAEGMEDGYVVRGLEVGKNYAVIETVVPQGYLEPVTNVTFIVANSKDVQKVVVVNEPTPTIGTTAAYIDGTKANLPEEMVKVVDVVKYDKLVVGQTYRVDGKLVNTEDPSIVYATQTVSFVADKVSGEVELEFVINSSQLAGTKIVAFEQLFRIGRPEDKGPIAKHEDPKDKGQTVYVPKVGTTAGDVIDNSHDALAAQEVTIIDTVAYTALEPNKEHKVSGKLMDKETNTPLLVDGKEVTAEAIFVSSETGNGEVKLSFTFNGLALEGKSVVAFEKVSRSENGVTIKVVATHEDINDESQTVHVPKVRTTAYNKADETKEISTQEVVTVVDVVKYSNLIVGQKYTVKGVMMDKETNAQLVIDGKAVVAEKEFVAESKDGEVKLEFTFDPKGLDGKELVVFEQLFNANAKLIGKHEDINDEGQTVRVPKVTTKADLQGAAREDEKGMMTITDKVTYKNLIIGKEYIVDGVLMDKETGKALLVDGKEVTATRTFVAEQANGSLDLTFEVPMSAVVGKTIVVFETLKRDGKVVVTHHDIEDKEQTVYVPKAETTAKFDDGSKESNPLETVTIIDTVKYSNLTIGKEYTVEGFLMDKETGKELLIDGKRVESSKTFVAEAQNGTIDIEFTIPGEAVRGKTLVVFETVLNEGKVVAVHHDINDDSQTVKVTDPKAGTTATVNGEKTAEEAKTLTIVDKISYTNLAVGKKYIAKGILMDKSTGKALLINGKTIEAFTEFTTESKDGFVNVTFAFDGSNLGGKELVVFEKVYEVVTDVNGKTTEKLVVTHEDINDQAQTVKITKKPEVVKTSDASSSSNGVNMTAITMTMAALALVLTMVKRKKEGSEE